MQRGMCSLPAAINLQDISSVCSRCHGEELLAGAAQNAHPAGGVRIVSVVERVQVGVALGFGERLRRGNFELAAARNDERALNGGTFPGATQNVNPRWWEGRQVWIDARSARSLLSP